MSTLYATYDDLIARYDEQDILLLSDKKRTGELNLDVLNKALHDATAEINGYLITRYRLPLAVVSSELVRSCCVIARYWLESGQNTEKAIKDYDVCIRSLVELRNGKTNLGLSEDDLITLPESLGNQVVIESEPTVWSRKAAKGFI